MRSTWYVWLFLLPGLAQSTRAMEADERCFCNFSPEVGVLSCSFPPSASPSLSLALPSGWCVEGGGRGGVEPGRVSHLRIEESRLDRNFSLDSLRVFKNLTSLTLNRNRVSRKTLSFAHAPAFALSLNQLNLSSNNLEHLSKDLFRPLKALTSVNIGDNNLTALPFDLFAGNPTLNHIHMKDNPWNCTELEWFLEWLRGREGVVEVQERSEVRCWYWERGTPFGTTTLAHLIDECPGACKCVMSRSMVRVDCRGLALTSFPPLLPLHTGILHMENNHINNFHSLLNGTNYLNLRFLYLDNNSIDSINVLEATDIFDGLFALHLSGNRLTEVPTHVIDRLFALYLDQVKFGNNPWNCECETVSPFYNLLLRFGNLARFKDIEDIRCSGQDSYHPNQPIYQLLTSDFCIVGTSYVNPLDIINAILITLILLIAIKVIYDYIRLRQTGRIPVGPFTCTFYRGY